MKLKNISNILKSSGFKNIELDSIIESNQVLKRSGGNFRQYLFSFYDENYKEWTLIPDLSLASVKKYTESKTNKKKNGHTAAKRIENEIKVINLPLLSKQVLKFLALITKP